MSDQAATQIVIPQIAWPPDEAHGTETIRKGDEDLASAVLEVGT